MTQLLASVKVGQKFKSDSETFFLRAMRSHKSYSERKYMYGSSAAFCPRQNYFLQSLGDGSAFTDEFSLMYMNIGNGIEAALVEALTSVDRLFFNNFRLPDMEPKVSGKIDLIYLDQDDKLAMAEVKSCGSLPSKPKESHLKQTLTYSAVSGLDIARLIYVSRNVRRGGEGPLLMRIFEIDTSPETLRTVLAQIAFTDIAIQNRQVPHILSHFRKDGECRFCSYKPLCWDGESHGHEEMTAENVAKFKAEAKAKSIALMGERHLRRMTTIDGLMAVTKSRRLKNLLEKL